jgi:DNA polymerase-4
LARGVDESQAVPDRPTQSISAEDTFERDVPLTETEPMIRKLAGLTWAASPKESRIARTVVLKLKTAEFKILTRSHTPSSPPSSCEELTAVELSLRERVALGPRQRFRVVGVGLSNFSTAAVPVSQQSTPVGNHPKNSGCHRVHWAKFALEFTPDSKVIVSAS